MQNLYDQYCAQPVLVSSSPLSEYKYVQRKKGETFWSLDSTNIPNMDEYFEQFYSDIAHYDNLSIDGSTACGKSTMLEGLNPVKVNKFFCVNKSNLYNIVSECSMTYIHLHEEFKKYPGLTTDRSIISNLTYLMVYYVMNVLTNNATFNKSMFGLCEDFVNIHNLKPTLEYIRGLKCNVLILIDSSHQHTATRTNRRGLNLHSNSDIVKPLCKQYHVAQTAAFAYFANFMNYRCIDFDYVRTSYNVVNEELMFSTNKKMFHKMCNFTPFTEQINIPKQIMSVGSDMLKGLHGEMIKISNR